MMPENSPFSNHIWFRYASYRKVQEIPKTVRDRPRDAPGKFSKRQTPIYKVITTMMIRLFDDSRAFCARSASTHLELWRKLYDCSWHHFRASQCVLKCVFSWHFRRFPTVWLQSKMGTVRSLPSIWELGVRGRSGIGPFDNLPTSSY